MNRDRVEGKGKEVTGGMKEQVGKRLRGQMYEVSKATYWIQFDILEGTLSCRTVCVCCVCALRGWVGEALSCVSISGGLRRCHHESRAK